MENRQKIALISVFNKTGITEFAGELVKLGWKIVSSGGTAKHLKDAEIPVTDVAEITGMPAILSHRVATLHPKIHGGLLALDIPEHQAELEKYDIPWIDMVCVDFYPLEDEIAKSEATAESVIEKTDIGGPTMVRAGAKGKRIVICDPKDRIKVIDWLKNNEPEREIFINNLAAKAEAFVSRYCGISGEYLSAGLYKGIFGEKKDECVYGENAYQKPAYHYAIKNNEDKLALHNWELVAGSAPSYNNKCDVDRMIQIVTHIGAGFEKNFNKVPFVAVGVKHGNACGASFGHTESEAIEKMLAGDLRAIFGGSVMFNFPIDEKLAEELIHKYMGEGRRLLDIVSAPSFTSEAIEILSRKKGKCRLLVNPNIEKAGIDSIDTQKRFRYVRGGFLEQPNYDFILDLNNQEFKFYPSRPSLEVLQNIVLGWAIGCTSNSNTISLVKENRLVGNGVGQQDRVGAAKLAILRADDANKILENNSSDANLNNAIAYSDSFFPFPDAVQILIDRGIKYIFSTSGSVNDEKIIELCNSKDVYLLMLPDSLARGFYQH